MQGARGKHERYAVDVVPSLTHEVLVLFETWVAVSREHLAVSVHIDALREKDTECKAFSTVAQCCLSLPQPQFTYHQPGLANFVLVNLHDRALVNFRPGSNLVDSITALRVAWCQWTARPTHLPVMRLPTATLGVIGLICNT